MPQVPYNPVPQGPQFEPSGPLAPQVTPEAFGVNVGQALERLGGRASEAGNELWNRAMWIQQIRNDSEARDLLRQGVDRSADAIGNYNTTKGKDAGDQWSSFKQRLNDEFDAVGQQASNPIVAKMFKDQAASIYGREVLIGARHMAEETKNYHIDTTKADATTAEQLAARHGDDEAFVNEQRKIIKQRIIEATIARHGVGENDPITKQAVDDALSHQRAEQILTKNETDPVQAAEWEKQYGDQLTNPADRDRVRNSIEGRASAVYGNNAANSIIASHLQPDGTYDATQLQMEQEARDKARKDLPDNPLAPDAAAKMVAGKLYMDTIASRRDKADATSQLTNMISTGNIHDEQALLAQPGAASLMARVDPKIRGNLQAYLNLFWKGSDRLSSEESMKIINGYRTSDGATFMGINPLDPKWHLSTSDMIKIQNQQFDMARKPTDDPRVTQAMGWLMGARPTELQALKVDRKYSGHEDDWAHFRGALQEAIQIWQEDNGKLPGYKDVIDTLGPLVLRTQASRAGFFSIFGYGQQTEPAFREYQRPAYEDVPEAWRTQKSEEIVKQGGVAPSPQQLTQAYARFLFNKYYKTTVKGKSGE